MCRPAALWSSRGPGRFAGAVAVVKPDGATDKQSAPVLLLTSFQGGAGPFHAQVWVSKSNVGGAPAELSIDAKGLRASITDETPDGEAFDMKPVEGATGWSDTWMINSKTKSINCAYLFVNHITSAPINIQIAEYFGEAPGNSKSCELATNPDHCTIFHAADTEYWTDVWYWTTPVEECLDGRKDVKCSTFDDWVAAWQEIRAG